MELCKCQRLKKHKIQIRVGTRLAQPSRSLRCGRTGGKGLKSTQVYPVGFGKKIASLHKDMMDFAGF